MDTIVDWQIPFTAYFLIIINAVLFEELNGPINFGTFLYHFHKN